MKKQGVFILSSLLAGLSSAAAVRAQVDPTPSKSEARSSLTPTVRKASQAIESNPDVLLAGGATSNTDGNHNRLLDGRDIAGGPGVDCNVNGVPDERDVRSRANYAFSVNPPEPILDGYTISRTFHVAMGGRVFDVDLGVALTHQYLGDLTITLTHGTTSVDVYFFGPCDACMTVCGFGGTVFDDEAAGSLPCVGLNEGRFRPANPLTAFDGQDAAGDWILSIFDGFIGFEGALTGWSLSIDASTPADCNSNGIPDECDTEIGESIDQWATTVLGFSSQFSDFAWSADQALGPPNTPCYCDATTAWASANYDGTIELITVGYDTPVFADGVTVRETSGNGFVTKIALVDTLGGIHTVWEGSDPSLPGTPVNFRIDWPRTDFLVAALTIYLDTNANLNTWEEIDAIQLHGAPRNSNDCNVNRIPDVCDLAAGSADCNANGIPDDCDIAPLGPTIDQWASQVIGFSSQYSVVDFAAAQALGEPNTFFYGPTAWAALAQNGTLEFITVGFPTPLYATGVTIREIAGQGMVYQVDVLDTNDVLHTVWQGIDPSLPGAPVDYRLTWPITGYQVEGVRIYMDTNHDLTSWELIDAIALHGRAGSDCNANGTDDWCEFGFSDCNSNGIPDTCEVLSPIHNCCDQGHGPGCSDPNIEACICSKIDPHCCAGDWDETCVLAVETYGCGSCVTGSADCNANGIPDDCDLAAGSVDCDANGVPDDCELGDFNDDFAVNLVDYQTFHECYTAPGVLVGPGCAAGDFDCDKDIDLRDFAAFQVTLSIR